MQYTRHSHGIVYSNGAVYVFGGIQNVVFYGCMTRKCERYVIDEDCWEEIQDLDLPRGDVGACIKDDNIYLLGKGSQYVVQYKSNDISIDLGEDCGGSIFADKGMIYAFHNSFIKICDISERKVIEKVPLPGNKSWWSHSPLVMFGDFIYLIYWEDPGWVCRFNWKTKEFIKLLPLRKD